MYHMSLKFYSKILYHYAFMGNNSITYRRKEKKDPDFLITYNLHIRQTNNNKNSNI